MEAKQLLKKMEVDHYMVKLGIFNVIITVDVKKKKFFKFFSSKEKFAYEIDY